MSLSPFIYLINKIIEQKILQKNAQLINNNINKCFFFLQALINIIEFIRYKDLYAIYALL